MAARATTKAKTETEKPVEPEAKPVEPEVAEPLVDLDDLAPTRPTVRYQSTLYELRTLDDFGILDQQKLTRDGREFFKLWSSDDELTRHQGERLKMLLSRMFDQVMDASDDVKQSLSDGKKSQVVLAFTLAPLAQRTAQMKADEETE
jgi:hypothetical protein